MPILHLFYQASRHIAPSLADYVKKKLKGERYAWELTQKEADDSSYYPDYPRKPLKQIRLELKHLCQIGNGSWIDSSTISHYFQFGLDRLGYDIDNYLFQEKYDKAREAMQPEYAKLLQHKVYTATILKQAKIKVSSPIGIIKAGGAVGNPIQPDIKLHDLFTDSSRKAYFCKPIDGFQSRDCYKVEYDCGFKLNGKSFSSTEAFETLLNHSIEPYIEQHPALNKLYANAVNTIRIVSISHNNKISIFYSCIMIGSEGSFVSGIPLGGIVVGIDKKNGVLCTPGHKSKKPNFGKLTHHPDTGIQLQGFQIPMWEEVIQLVKDAHQVLGDIHSIGWDIAITPMGPIIVEANNDWGTMVAEYISDNHLASFKRFFTQVTSSSP